MSKEKHGHEMTIEGGDKNMEWNLICQDNVKGITKHLQKIIDSKSEDVVKSAKDALCILETGLHESNVKPIDM